ERGFDGATVADIAQVVGVSKGSVLYHFRSKEDLWKSAVERAVANFEAVLVYGTGEATFQAFVEGHRRFMRACLESPAYLRIIALEMLTDSWRSRWIGER